MGELISIKLLYQLPSQGKAFGLAYSSDGHYLAYGCDSDVLVYRVTDAKLSQTFPGNGFTQAVAFSPAGPILASSHLDETRLWNLTNQQLSQSLPGGSTQLAYNADGRFLAVASRRTGIIQLWDTQKNELLHTFEGQIRWIRKLVWSPDSERLVSVGEHQLEFWNVANRTLRRTDQGQCLAWSPDGQYFLIASDKVQLRRTSDGALLRTFPIEERIQRVSWGSKGQVITCIDSQRVTQFWLVADVKLLTVLQGVKDLVWNSDGQTFTINRENGVFLWRVEYTPEFQQRMKTEGGRLEDLRLRAPVTSLLSLPETRQIAEQESLVLGFRASTRLSEVFKRRNILFFPNPTAILGNKDLRRKADFLVCQQGKWGILTFVENYAVRNSGSEQDWAKLFSAYGVTCVEFYDVTRCYNDPEATVDDFLARLALA